MDEVLLVVDAMAGQDAVNVAKAFNEAVAVDGIILTKTDGDTRGGAALSVKAVTGKPIKFQGTGEKLDDLEVFHPARMASRILGMGDVLTLIEKAQETQDQKKAAETAKRHDGQQVRHERHAGPACPDEKDGRRFGHALHAAGRREGQPRRRGRKSCSVRMEAIIHSMTPAERAKPAIIDPKRKRRIAAGSGTTVEEVNRLLRQFEADAEADEAGQEEPPRQGPAMMGCLSFRLRKTLAVV